MPFGLARKAITQATSLASTNLLMDAACAVPLYLLQRQAAPLCLCRQRFADRL